MNIFQQIAIGFVFSSLIGAAAYWRGSLSKSGIAGAVIVGTLVFGFGGWTAGLLLIAFFVSSSLLSHYRESAKADIAADKFDKGHARDLNQVVANGGAGALLALAGWMLGGDMVVFAAFVGAMASVNADTWATELGVLSRAQPRLITNFRPVEKGTSGGISAAGTLATASGALFIGLLAVAFSAAETWLAQGSLPPALMAVIPAALLGGVAGSLFDSLLGATVQAINTCPTCGSETERQVHRCGTTTIHKRGMSWLSNDLVNLFSSLVGAGVCAVLWLAAAG